MTQVADIRDFTNPDIGELGIRESQLRIGLSVLTVDLSTPEIFEIVIPDNYRIGQTKLLESKDSKSYSLDDMGIRMPYGGWSLQKRFSIENTPRKRQELIDFLLNHPSARMQFAGWAIKGKYAD